MVPPFLLAARRANMACMARESAIRACASVIPAVVLCGLLLPAAAAAQPAPVDFSASGLAGDRKGTIETKHLTVRPSASVTSAAPGSRVDLHLDVTPRPSMHVYAPGQQDVIPVRLTLRDIEGLRAAATRFPEAETFYFAPLDETQLVYSRPFRLTRPITLGRAAELQRAAGTLTITGTFEYQACDDAICYLPQKVPVSWTIQLK